MAGAELPADRAGLLKSAFQRRGTALMLVVVVYSTLVLSIWGLANRQTVTLLRFQELRSAWMASQFGVQPGTQLVPEGRELDAAMAIALARLDTGAPVIPDGETSVSYVHFVSEQPFILSYEPSMIPDDHEWTVQVEPAGDPLPDLPALPDSF